MKVPAQSASSDILAAFDYLRNESVDAHLAGDGMRVLHLCTIALERVRHAQASSMIELAQVRWAFFLGLYWMVDDFLTYLIEDALKQLPAGGHSAWDCKLIRFLTTTLSIPLKFDSIEELLTAPTEWLHDRSTLVEDDVAMCLATEITWYKDYQATEWRDLATAWLSRLPPESPLSGNLQRTVERLSLQSAFCKSGQLPNVQTLGGAVSFEQSQIVEAWRLCYDTQFNALDALLRSLVGRVRTESPAYSSYLSVVHYSRIARDSKESQFLSLSRLHLVQSRQVSQTCRLLRDERFESSFSKIARLGFVDEAAFERYKCFRMAMLNQLHALRSWDIGGWLHGERQRAQALLELSARGDLTFVTSSILALRNSLHVPDRGKYPHFDQTVQLLDALSEAERCVLTKSLIASPRIAWTAARHVLDELSDAIPADLIQAVAGWYVQVDVDEYQQRWRKTILKVWGQLLQYYEDSADLIEILKPALMKKVTMPFCWDELHGTLCAAIIKGHSATARALVDALVSVAPSDKWWDEHRFSVLYNVARRRPGIASVADEWLRNFAAERGMEFHRFKYRHKDHEGESPIDDPVFREWVRDKLMVECETRLCELGPSVTIAHEQYDAMLFELEWPAPEPELVGRLIEVVDAAHVPFVNKDDAIACLAVLTLRCPKSDNSPVVPAIMKWLDQGVGGRELGHAGPLSMSQMVGFRANSIEGAFAFLLEVAAEKYFGELGSLLTEWALSDAIRSSPSVVEHVLGTVFHSSVGASASDEPLSVALVGMAEAIAASAFQVEPRRTLDGFTRVVLNNPLKSDVRAWLKTRAGNLCLGLWEKRIVDGARLANPDAREAAARAIHCWRNAGNEVTAALRESSDQLLTDCRMRVRKANANA